ncbi:MAG TPA: FtsX-like permease family protein [Chitinophagaceae bacterium]|nr:FtsX-like permease family protein [Chitinophagaceae bacterium]
MITKLTWRNLWRNKRRTFITMGSVTFAVVLAVAMQSFQRGIFDNLVKNVVGFYYGYIQMHSKGYWEERIIDNGFIPDDSLLQRLQQTDGVTKLVPRLETFVLVSSGNTTKGAMLVGTDPEKENEFSHLETKLINGTYFTGSEEQAILGEGLSERLNITTGDTIVILSQGYQGTLAAGKYPVKAIAHFGSPDLNDRVLYLPLATTQSFLNAEGLLTSVSFGIHDPGKMMEVQQNISASAGSLYEIMNWKELMPEIANHIRADGGSFYIFTGILYLIIAFGIFGTILMMTTERRFEFGMLVAIGMKKIRLGLTLLIETIWITIAGVVAGLLISWPIVTWFSKNPIRISGKMAEVYERFGFEALFPTAVHVPIFITQSVIVLTIALLLGLYPVWYVFKLDPVSAMKK